jgi:hypothetical protein
MGSDTLAPSFIDNVFDLLEVAGAQRRDVAGRTIDDFGEPRQFDLLVLGKQIEIKVLKQWIAWTRRSCRREREDTRILTAAIGTLDGLGVFLFQIPRLACIV